MNNSINQTLILGGGFTGLFTALHLSHQRCVEIFDRVEVKGKLGHLIRQGTYIQLLPKPVHNFKTITEWLTDEVFHQFSNA